MVEQIETYYEDRSGAETDDKCGMAYFWNRIYGHQGIVPVEEAAALEVGREVHEDLAAVAELEDISAENIQAIIDELTDLYKIDDMSQAKKEVFYRRLGWLAAFALYVEPRIREEYEDIAVEGELILDRFPLWIAVTPDRVLRHRKGGYLVYREYKSTISASQKWIQSWPFAIQIHLGLAAIEEELGEKVAFGQVMGLMKGDVRSGRLSHPYVWGWRNEATGAWTHEYSKARSADWGPAPVWEYPDGVVAWVKLLGPEVANEQFPHSMPVMKNEKMITEWVARRIHRQKVISLVEVEAQTDLDVRNIYFEKRTRNCRPPFGDACPYLGPCWNAAIEANPLATGDFKPREPHHEVEITMED